MSRSATSRAPASLGAAPDKNGSCGAKRDREMPVSISNFCVRATHVLRELAWTGYCEERTISRLAELLADRRMTWQE